MIILKLTPDSNGAYVNQTGEFKIVPVGYIAIPPALEAQTKALLPWIKPTIKGGVVVSITENTTVKSAWLAAQAASVPQPTLEERIAKLESDTSLLKSSVSLFEVSK